MRRAARGSDSSHGRHACSRKSAGTRILLPQSRSLQEGAAVFACCCSKHMPIAYPPELLRHAAVKEIPQTANMRMLTALSGTVPTALYRSVQCMCSVALHALLAFTRHYILRGRCLVLTGGCPEGLVFRCHPRSCRKPEAFERPKAPARCVGVGCGARRASDRNHTRPLSCRSSREACDDLKHHIQQDPRTGEKLQRAHAQFAVGELQTMHIAFTPSPT